MSMSLSTGKALMATAAIGAATASQAPAAAPPSMWAILVLGIPLGVLAASLGGSAVRSLRDPSQPDAKLPGKVIAMVCDGFIGGWAAMFLVGSPYTQQYIGHAVRAEVVGALCALLVQFIRDNGADWIRQGVKAFLSWFTRKRAGGEP